MKSNELMGPYFHLCNGMASHSPIIGDFIFPLCWRCTAVLCGFLICLFILLRWRGKVIAFLQKHNGVNQYVMSELLVLPLVIDSFLQNRCSIESTTFRRISTGLLFGFGVSYAILQIVFLFFRYHFNHVK